MIPFTGFTHLKVITRRKGRGDGGKLDFFEA